MGKSLDVKYVPPAWAGRASDKTIFLDAKPMIDRLDHNSSVLVDRGFTVSGKLRKLYSVRGVRVLSKNDKIRPNWYP